MQAGTVFASVLFVVFNRMRHTAPMFLQSDSCYQPYVNYGGTFKNIMFEYSLFLDVTMHCVVKYIYSCFLSPGVRHRPICIVSKFSRFRT